MLIFFSVKSFSEQKLKALYFYEKAFAILLFKLSILPANPFQKKEPKNLNFYVKSITVQCCFLNNAFFLFFSVKPFSEQELKTLNFYMKSFAVLPHCGKYGNSLSCIFGKDFVKVCCNYLQIMLFP